MAAADIAKLQQQDIAAVCLVDQFGVPYVAGTGTGTGTPGGTTAVGRYNANPSARAEGDTGPLQTNNLGQLLAVILNTLSVNAGRYNAAPANRSEGEIGPLQTDAQGRLLAYLATKIAGEDLTVDALGVVQKATVSQTYSWPLDASVGAATTRTSKATPALLGSIYVTNKNAGIRYFQVYNALNANGIPLLEFDLPAASGAAPYTLIVGDDLFGPNGVFLSTGLTWGISTTSGAYVAATASEHKVVVRYV